MRCTFGKNFGILRVLLTVTPMFAISSLPVQAAILHGFPCTLNWNVCTNHQASGYVLYYGVRGSTTTNRVDVGLTNTATLQALCAGSNYFFYVTAYNVCGVESSPSSAINYTSQVFSPVTMARTTNGGLSLHFETGTDAVCHVEYTPTLHPAQWQTLSSATADANGKVTVTDPLSGNPTTRFYRTASP